MSPRLQTTTLVLIIQMNLASSLFGCTDESALNYNEFATNNDGSCILPTLGCTNPTATNYDPLAN